MKILLSIWKKDQHFSERFSIIKKIKKKIHSKKVSGNKWNDLNDQNGQYFCYLGKLFFQFSVGLILFSILSEKQKLKHLHFDCQKKKFTWNVITFFSLCQKTDQFEFHLKKISFFFNKSFSMKTGLG